MTSTPDPAPLTITKDQSPTTPAPGRCAITYTVVVTNPSAFTTAHATFDDPVPAQIVADGGWTTTTTGAGTTATPASAATGFPAGCHPGHRPGRHGDLHHHRPRVRDLRRDSGHQHRHRHPGPNTACADGQPTCQAEASFTNPAQLEVAKTHAPTDPHPVPGQQVTYTVTVTNPGNSATGSGTFSDPLPDPPLDAAAATWTCTPEHRVDLRVAAGEPPHGHGIADRRADHGGPQRRHGDLHHHRHHPAQWGNGDGPQRRVGHPRHRHRVRGRAADLRRPRTPSQPPRRRPPHHHQNPQPGVPGPGRRRDLHHDGHQHQRPPPRPKAPWTTRSTLPRCTASPGPQSPPPGRASTEEPTASGTGPIQSVPVVLAVEGTVTFTVQATVRGDWAGGDVTNTASVTPGTNTECSPDADPSCSATTTFPTPSLITITKTHEPTHPEPQPGQNVTYRVTVTNLSDQQAANATIDEPLPPQLDRSTATWTTTTTGTGTTATPASGTGPPTGVAVTLAPEGTVTFTITAEILTTFPGGSITNTASATPGDNTACQNGDPVCDASTAFNSDPPPAALAISKTADSGTEPWLPVTRSLTPSPSPTPQPPPVTAR